MGSRQGSLFPENSSDWMSQHLKKIGLPEDHRRLLMTVLWVGEKIGTRTVVHLSLPAMAKLIKRSVRHTQNIRDDLKSYGFIDTAKPPAGRTLLTFADWDEISSFTGRIITKEQAAIDTLRELLMDADYQARDQAQHQARDTAQHQAQDDAHPGDPTTNLTPVDPSVPGPAPGFRNLFPWKHPAERLIADVKRNEGHFTHWLYDEAIDHFGTSNGRK